MDEEFDSRVATYLAQRNLRPIKQLGAGIHGVVYEVIDNSNNGRRAVKFHRMEDAYRRERNVYLRFRKLDRFEIRGCSIPEMLASDDRFMAIEMTIVDRPYVLDFGAAYLDSVPNFTPDPYEEEELKERFGDAWPRVQGIVEDLRSYGIFQLDLSPNNVAFRD